MELDNIEKLLKKYFDATTTAAEEEVLRTYFLTENIAPHFEHYVPMFTYFSEAKKERFTRQVPLAPKKNYLKWASIAAIAVLMVGFYFYRLTPTPVTLTDAYTEEEIASAKEAFALLALNFNKATEQLYHLEEFERTTNKFLIKE